MKYDKNDPVIVTQMALAALSLVDSGDCQRIQLLAAAVRKGVEDASAIDAAIGRKCGDAYLATILAILLEDTPNAQAICDLAIAKGEQMDMLYANHELGNLMNAGKVVGEA